MTDLKPVDKVIFDTFKEVVMKLNLPSEIRKIIALTPDITLEDIYSYNDNGNERKKANFRIPITSDESE